MMHMPPDITQSSNSIERKSPKIKHYYGDTVRGLFMVAGILLLVEFLFDRQLLEFNLSIGILVVLILTFLAGYTSPESKIVVFWNVTFSAIAFFVSEYFVLTDYLANETILRTVFILRQGVAVLFLVSLYFSVKTWRGFKPVPPDSIN